MPNSAGKFLEIIDLVKYHYQSMIDRLKKLIRRRPSFEKHSFKFNGHIPRELPALVIFPEDKTPFFDALALFYSISKYHESTSVVLTDGLKDGFRHHFPHVKFFLFNDSVGQDLRNFFAGKLPVVYLMSMYNDIFSSFPEKFSGSFDVAIKRFSSHYNFLLDTEPNDYQAFVNDFLKISSIENRVEEFKNSFSLKRNASKSIFLDSRDPEVAKILKNHDNVITTFKFEKYDFNFVGDKSFEELLKIALNSKIIVAEDSIFTGYALHYHVPVFSENCKKYYKNQNCKSIKSLKL